MIILLLTGSINQFQNYEFESLQILRPFSHLAWVDFNPKRCGLFGQLRMHGWSKSAQWEMAVSGCFNFHPNSTNSTSYESWHLQLKFYTLLRLTRLKLQPRWSQQHLQPYIIKKLPDPNGWLIPSTKMVHFCGVRPVEATICYFF